VRRPKDKELLFSRLLEEGVFETYRDVMVFGAALGFARNRSESFEQSAEPIAWNVFSGAGHEALVNMIAGVSKGDLNILSDDRFDERLTIFEDYANGGLNALKEVLSRSTTPALDIVLDLIAEMEKPPQESPGEIKTIAKELSW
jgi:dnd system-associated protein 4